MFRRAWKCKTGEQSELVINTFNVAVCKQVVPFVVFDKPRDVRGECGQVFGVPVNAAALPQLFEPDCGYKLARLRVIVV